MTDEEIVSHARTAAANLNTILREIQNRDLQFQVDTIVLDSRMKLSERTIYGIELTFTKEIK